MYLFYAMASWANAAKLRHVYSLDFTRVAVYLVVQVDLPKCKVVCCEQLTPHWNLNRRQGDQITQ